MNECTPLPEVFLGFGEEKILSFEPGVENFYSRIDVYGNPSISEEELAYVREELTKAAQFVADIASNSFALQPLFGRLKVIYRPNCLTLPEAETGYIAMKLGFMMGDTIVLRPMNLFENKTCTYKSRETLDPGDMVSLASIAAHEMLQTYFFPRFHADPAKIVEEGLLASAQFMYGSDYGGFSHTTTIAINGRRTWAYYREGRTPLMHQQFPPSPAVPLSSYLFDERIDIQVAGRGGRMRDVAVTLDVAGQFIITVDGEERGTIAAGEYVVLDELGYAIAVGVHSGRYNLHILNSHDEVRRIASIGEIESSGSVKFGEYGMIWAKNGAGGTDVFMRAPVEFSSVDYSFDQQEKKVGIDPDNYVAAFIMHTELEKLYWRTHSDEPGFHPGDYYKRLGELHKKYREYLFNDPSVSVDKGKYYNGVTNVYHDLCAELSLPLDECLDIFKRFGLDVDYFDPATGENTCLPDNNKEPRKINPAPIPDNDDEVSEGGYSGGSAGGCYASPASANHGRSIDRAISETLRKAIEEYKYLIFLTRGALRRLLK